MSAKDIPTRLVGEDLNAALAEFSHWRLAHDSLSMTRQFRFKSFSEAFAFMQRIALQAEKMDHHPRWTNEYDRVEITLATHDCVGISDKDIVLARFIDKLYERK